MDVLRFVETNKGPVALRRHEHAETIFITQVWNRTPDGEWKQRHYYSNDRSEIAPGMLEALYQGARKRQLPYEDFW